MRESPLCPLMAAETELRATPPAAPDKYLISAFTTTEAALSPLSVPTESARLDRDTPGGCERETRLSILDDLLSGFSGLGRLSEKGQQKTMFASLHRVHVRNVASRLREFCSALVEQRAVALLFRAAKYRESS